jgi:hypothetical protein
MFVSSLASTKSSEERCKAQAEKHRISRDKPDAYVKTCVDKHMQHIKHVKYNNHTKKKLAARADTPAPAAVPAAPAK